MYKYNQNYIKFIFPKSTLRRSTLTDDFLIQTGTNIAVGQKFSKGDVAYRRCNITELMVMIHQLFIFELFEGQARLRQFLGRAPRLGQARGPGAAATCPYRSCKTTCQQVGCVVQRIWRRSEVEYGRYVQVEKYTTHRASSLAYPGRGAGPRSCLYLTLR